MTHPLYLLRSDAGTIYTGDRRSTVALAAVKIEYNDGWITYYLPFDTRPRMMSHRYTDEWSEHEAVKDAALLILRDLIDYHHWAIYKVEPK